MKICIAFQSIAANEMNGDFILQKKIAGGTSQVQHRTAIPSAGVA